LNQYRAPNTGAHTDPISRRRHEIRERSPRNSARSRSVLAARCIPPCYGTWREISQFIGGIALVALIQTGLLSPDTRDFIGSWMIMAFFGTIYAVIGGITTEMFEKRRRASMID